MVYLSVIILSSYIILDSLEILMNSQLYNFTSPITINKYNIPNYLRKKKCIYFLYNVKWFKVLTFLRLVLGILLIIYYDDKLFYLFLFPLLLLIEAYFRFIFINRLTSADHVIFFNLICLTFFRFTNDRNILYLIPIFLIVSYFFNGLNKIKSNYWLKNNVLLDIFSTNLYGSQYFTKVIGEKKIISKIIVYFIIFFQVSFCLFFINFYFAIFYFFAGVIFHFIIAIFMRLRDFLFAFLSSYPILLLSFYDFHNIF